MIYGIVLTLCIFGQCNESVPETFDTETECYEALADIDSTYPDSKDLFTCKEF